MSVVSQELQTTSERESIIDEGLIEAARALRDNPKQRELLEKFTDGTIHEHWSGSIAQDRGAATVVYWHDHGTFVAPDGAIYQVRTDDDDINRQVYVAPNDSEWAKGLPCIQPWTYDGVTGPHGITMRFDFLNGPRRIVTNTLDDMKKQRLEGADPTMPRHKEWADEARDSISIEKHRDGRITGVLHDGQSRTDTLLYAPDEVRAVVAMIDEAEREIEIMKQGGEYVSRDRLVNRLGEVGVFDVLAYELLQQAD